MPNGHGIVGVQIGLDVAGEEAVYLTLVPVLGGELLGCDALGLLVGDLHLVHGEW